MRAEHLNCGSLKAMKNNLIENFMYRYLFIIGILIFSVSTFPAMGDEPDISIETGKTESTLLRIKNASSKIKTLTGDFIQKKNVEIVKNMPDSKGKFFYKKPDRLRWEVVEPVKMGFIVNGDQGKKWRKKAARYRKFEVSKEPIISVISSQVFAWARGDFDKLREGYEISILDESPIKVKLVPLSSVEKKYVSSIILSFSDTDDYVECLEINETRGGCTQVTFLNMVPNDQLEEDMF